MSRFLLPVRFVIVGATSTAVNYGIFIGLISLHLHYLIASSFAWVVTVSLSYFLNKQFTFSSTAKISAVEAGKYMSVYLLQFALSSVLYIIFISGFGLTPAAAFLVNLIFTSVLSFCLLRGFVFVSFPAKCNIASATSDS
jgi:putative flippase GtrA